MSKNKLYVQHTLDGQLVSKYKTLQEASDASGTPLTTIWELINGKKKTYSGDYFWSEEMMNEGPIGLSGHTGVAGVAGVNGHTEHTGPKILFFDLESTPMVSYHFGLFKQFISLDQVIEKPHLICWAAKWGHEGEVFGDCNTPEEMLEHDDKRISQSLWRAMNEADIVVAHYGNGFDVPLANTRFVINGLPPLTPNKSVDTKQISSKYFKMYSNKLDALAELFGIDGKFSTDFNLWKHCMEGKQSALDEMFEYNLQDVLVLEKVYYKLLPYANNHPNVAVYNPKEESEVCSRCGSTHLVPIDKKYVTSVSAFKTVRCQDCGAISRERSSVLSKEKRKSMLTTIR